MSRFYEYLTDDEMHIKDVMIFLSGQEFDLQRQRIRPLLVALAEDEKNARKERKESTIDRGVKVWIDAYKKLPDKDMLKSFWDVAKKDQTITDFLSFAVEVVNHTHPEQPLNITIVSADNDTIISLLPPLHTWPIHMKVAYEQHVVNSFSQPVGQIRVALSQYPRETSSSLIPAVLFSREEVQAGRRRNESRQRTNHSIITEEPGKSEERKETMKPTLVLLHRTGTANETDTHFLKSVDESERDGYISKVADRYAEGDLRMKSDIEKILDSLVQDPFGLGTKKLVDEEVVIRRRKRSLYRLAPDKRGYSLRLLHDRSKNLRITYVVMEENGQTYLGIEGIRTHAEFDDKFAARRG